MRNLLRLLIPIFLLLLIGCQSDEEYKSSMFSNKTGELQFYFIFSDHNQEDNTSVYNEVMEHLYEHMDSNVSTVSMSSQTERIINVYDIKEFPTFLSLIMKVYYCKLPISMN